MLNVFSPFDITGSRKTSITLNMVMDTE
ncbi:hypothetical protein PBAL39_23277 [Pedobacter sp. BAL39]|nr:hypothetical protein PBAL39_23277 [Pedobacter sp. BAL39]